MATYLRDGTLALMSLSGKRILVTRDEGQAGEFAALVRQRGGIPVVFPTVRLVPPDDPAPLDAALARLSGFDWILFTSANGARFFLERAAQRGIRGIPEGVRVASVGPGTSGELRRCGVAVHLTAEKHTAEGLVEALSPHEVAGKRFLFPRAMEGRDVIPGEIGRRGGFVEVVTAYRNGLPQADGKIVSEIVAAPPDVCTFASPSAFRNFFLLLGEERAASVLARTLIAVIGEVTARAVEGKGFRVDIVPRKYTLAGMLKAIAARLSASPGGGESA